MPFSLVPTTRLVWLKNLVSMIASVPKNLKSGSGSYKTSVSQTIIRTIEIRYTQAVPVLDIPIPRISISLLTLGTSGISSIARRTVRLASILQEQ